MIWRSGYSSPGGDFLIKIFQGEGFDVYHKDVRKMFDKMQMSKPMSSRGRSREQYMLARGFRGVEVKRGFFDRVIGFSYFATRA